MNVIGEDKRILIAGDAMLDSYHFGQVDRISPEAPVPVFLETDRNRFVPGGAANVAVNISAIGVGVDFFTVTGDDENGKRLLGLLNSAGVGTEYVMALESRRTTTKLRYIGPNNQQILRVDDEQAADVSADSIESMIRRVSKSIERYGLFVLSDYKKGFLSEEITRRLIELAVSRKIPVLVDVKDINVRKYRDATILKPNRKELHELSGMSTETKDEVVLAASALCKKTPCSYVLATLGADGMLLADKNGMIAEVKSTASEVFDVTGAGDTSLAYLAAEMLRGMSIENAMVTANFAAAVQVSKVGTSVVTPDEVEAVMRGESGNVKDKVLPSYSSKALRLFEKYRVHHQKVVFTNGCFDILHIGHISYLREAKRLGDVLVIGINSDASVSRLKGDGRPINSLSDRMEMLAALDFVDYVIPFDEDTPEALIRSVQPDVLVKGGDYVEESIVGADFVKERGGKVVVLPFVAGHSTTAMIKRIQGEA